MSGAMFHDFWNSPVHPWGLQSLEAVKSVVDSPRVGKTGAIEEAD